MNGSANDSEGGARDVRDVPQLLEVPWSKEAWKRGLTEKVVLWLFGGAVAVALVCGMAVLIIGAITGNVESTIRLLKDGYVPLVQAVAAFSGLGPLVAFMLGHYFRGR